MTASPKLTWTRPADNGSRLMHLDDREDPVGQIRRPGAGIWLWTAWAPGQDDDWTAHGHEATAQEAMDQAAQALTRHLAGG